MASRPGKLEPSEPRRSPTRRADRSRTWAVLALLVASISVIARGATVWILGDSTAASYAASQYPQTGWGQVLRFHLDSSRFKVKNRAVPGASIVSYESHANWKNVSDSLGKGDILIVQFGHNSGIPGSTSIVDSAMYARFLDTFALAARTKGAVPLFVTSINKNLWNQDTVFESFCQPGNNFWQAMVDEGRKLGVPVVDLEKLTKADLQRRGKDYAAKYLYLGLDSLEYPNYPAGLNDPTHLQEMGALNVSGMFASAVASHPDTLLKALREALLPCDSLLVLAHDGDVDLMTSCGCYPKGASVTLKLHPRKGKLFKGWNNEKGLMIDTARRRMETMAGQRILRRPVFVPDTSTTDRMPPPIRNGRTLSFANPSVVVHAMTLDGRSFPMEASPNGSWTLPRAGVYVLLAVTDSERYRWTMVAPD